MNGYDDTLQGRLGVLLGAPRKVYGLGVSGLSISDYLGAVAARAGRVQSVGGRHRHLRRRYLGKRLRCGRPLLLRIEGRRSRARVSSAFASDSIVKKIRMRIGDISLYRYLQRSLGFAPGNLFKWLQPGAGGGREARGRPRPTGCSRSSTHSCASCRPLSVCRRGALHSCSTPIAMRSTSRSSPSKRKDDPELRALFPATGNRARLSRR